jgi:hypothetical protein
MAAWISYVGGRQLRESFSETQQLKAVDTPSQVIPDSCSDPQRKTGLRPRAHTKSRVVGSLSEPVLPPWSRNQPRINPDRLNHDVGGASLEIPPPGMDE